MKELSGAIAGGVTGAALFAVCIALVGVLPGFARSYSDLVFHGLDVSSLIVRPDFTVGNLLLGLAYAFLTGAFIGGVFVAAYNKIERRK